MPLPAQMAPSDQITLSDQIMLSADKNASVHVTQSDRMTPADQMMLSDQIMLSDQMMLSAKKNPSVHVTQLAPTMELVQETPLPQVTETAGSTNLLYRMWLPVANAPPHQTSCPPSDHAGEIG